MRISIALAPYNGERFIREQLDSLARQTYLPYELVVTDDGSSDRTLEIAEDFSQTAPFPVRVYRNEQRLGYGDNFLKAASLCEGEWIAFCDQDDVWFDGKLARVSQCFEVENAVLVVHSAMMTDENLISTGKRTPNIKRYQIVRSLMNRPWFTPAGFVCCFDARLIHKYPWQQRPSDFNYSERMQAHDQWIYLLANVLGIIVYLPDVLSFYRRHAGAITGNYNQSHFIRLASVFATGENNYNSLCRISQEYVEIFRRLSTSMDVGEKMQMLKAMDYFTKLAHWHKERANLYCCNSIKQRSLIFFMLYKQGAYLPFKVKGLGKKAFIKDLLKIFLPKLTFFVSNS